jgi:hypothetical protein
MHYYCTVQLTDASGNGFSLKTQVDFNTCAASLRGVYFHVLCWSNDANSILRVFYISDIAFHGGQDIADLARKGR